MEPIRIIYRHYPGYGWSFDSPDIPGLIGGDVTLEDARRMAEEAVEFYCDGEAEDRGEPAPTTYPPVEHYVPAPA